MPLLRLILSRPPACRRAGALWSWLCALALAFVLAAAASGSFMGAQTRSEVSRIKAEMRQLGAALEQYRVDYGKYPITYPIVGSYGTTTSTGAPLSSLRAYLAKPMQLERSYSFFNYERIVLGDWATVAGMPPRVLPHFRGFLVWHSGPDRTDSNLYWGPVGANSPSSVAVYTRLIYDPTNGNLSSGDMGFTVGEMVYPGLQIDR
jgi:hypothetical protein